MTRPDTSPPPRVVVITGGSSGIGRGTAATFARAGFRVGVIARGEAGLRAACADVAALGGIAAMAIADVTDPDALEASAAALELALGPIGVWINCAGNGTYGRFLDIPPDQFARVTDVTYLGTVNGTRAALRRMLPRDWGRIVNVCSAVAFHGMPLLASYSGAKHAVRGFGQAIQAELAQDASRVTLCTVFPPAVNTPFFDHAISHMGRPGRPIPPVYQPEIVADAILLAALSHRNELPISFTTVAFAAGMRLSPGLVGRAVKKLGYAGQLAQDEAATIRHHPTLFAPSAKASPVHGGFGAEARRFSVHIRLLRAVAPRHPSASVSPIRARVTASNLAISAWSSARGFGRAAARFFA